MSQSIYGGYLGNAGALSDLVYRGEPVDLAPMPYYGGGLGIDELAGGNFMGGEGLQINPEAHKKSNRQMKIYNKGMGTDNPNEREIFLKRTGPQLPLAGVGNVGALLAQAEPFYGDVIDMGPLEGDYSNMPVIPDPEQQKINTEALLEEFRNRVFPPAYTEGGFNGAYLT
jgi:hypothetical protein